jgi:hypothetical protein
MLCFELRTTKPTIHFSMRLTAMKGYHVQIATTIALLFFVYGPRADAQMDVDWVGAPGTPLDYNTGANWDAGFPPAAFASEFGEINNGGIAFVADQPTSANPGPGGLTLGEDPTEFGGLEVRSGGRLEVLTDELANVIGNVVVGLNGEGVLTVLRGGALNVANDLSSGGNAASRIVLGETGGSGTATLAVAGTSRLGRTTRVIGPNVDFTTGSLRLGNEHNLIAQITGATHSAIKADSASLDGSVNVEFSGVTPALGDTWDLVDASSISGRFSSVSTNAILPQGLGLLVSNQAGGTNGSLAQLSVGVQLVLSVDRQTGEASIHNRSTGGTVEIDGYAILSEDDALSPANWTSLAEAGQADWFEGNATDGHLTELNLVGTRTIGPNSSVSIGSPYAVPTTPPTEIGGQDRNVTFEYTSPDGTFAGVVDFIGFSNNVALIVNPATGEAAIQNQSIFDVNLDGYAILSGAASLDAAGWTSLEDSGQAGWFESAPADNHLTELNLEGDTLLASRSAPISLGTPFRAGAVRDLMFEYTLSTGETLLGVVDYAEIPDMPPDGIPGDYNNNGTVEQADLDLVLLNWGTGGVPAGWTNDLPEGNIDQAELDGVLLNWGDTGAAGLGAAAGVPEPATWLVALVALVAMCACGKVRRLVR